MLIENGITKAPDLVGKLSTLENNVHFLGLVIVSS